MFTIGHKKKAAPAARKPLSVRLQGLVDSAAFVGYASGSAFAEGVTLFRSIGQANAVALVDASLQFKAGYVVRYLEDTPDYPRRVGNMNQAERFEDALLILAKAAPGTAKPNRRSAIEQSACKAASESASAARKRAFNIKPKKRAPRQTTATDSNPVPVDLVKASPKFATVEEGNTYFAEALAALLATVSRNARKVKPQISSAIEDCNATIKAALSL